MASVALVVLDTLRKDTFDAHFDWLPGRRFENAWAPSHWTAPVHGGLFTGKYPTEIGVVASSPSLDCPEATLPEQLSAAGYETRAFSCNPYVSSAFGFDRGFHQFEGSWRLRMFDENLFDWNAFLNDPDSTGLSRFPRAFWQCVTEDCTTLDSLHYGLNLKLRDYDRGRFRDDGAGAALTWARETNFGESEFAFLNLMEAHMPYSPPPSYRTVEMPEIDMVDATISGSGFNTDDARQAYEDSVRYLSDVYRDIHSELSATFDYVITISDHGELLGEHDTWGHWHGIYPELTHIPVCISGDVSETNRVESLVSLLDIHATIADATDVEVESRGESLLGDIGRKSAVTEYHGLQQRVRNRLESEGRPQEIIGMYDNRLDGVALPSDYYGYETVDGFHERGQTDVVDPQDNLRELIDNLDRRRIHEMSDDVSQAVIDQLKDLGYA